MERPAQPQPLQRQTEPRHQGIRPSPPNLTDTRHGQLPRARRDLATGIAQLRHAAFAMEVQQEPEEEKISSLSKKGMPP